MNALLQNIAKYDITSTITKAPIIDRNHFSAPSAGGYHHPYQGYNHEYSGHSSHSNQGGGKHSIALTALTLLAFLFFLNILQNCLQEHMDQMNPQVIIMQARIKAAREAEAEKRKGETAISLFTNTSLGNEDKEARFTPDITLKQKIKYQYGSIEQVPVKLKSVEKYKMP